MSGPKTAGGKLSSLLRTLFGSLRQRQSKIDMATPSTIANGLDGSSSSEKGPAQRLLTGPQVTPPSSGTTIPRPSGGPLVQTGFFEPSKPRPGSRTLFLTDFVERFHKAMRQAGVTPRDPLHPVLTMLGEMLVHLTQLQADHIGVFERASDIATVKLQEESARLEASIARERQEISRSVSQGSKRIENAATEIGTAREEVRTKFSEQSEVLIRDSITKEAKQRTLSGRLMVTAVASVSLFSVGLAGISYGRSQERQDNELALQAIKNPLLEAALREGKEAAQMWLNLMVWNSILKSAKRCDPQPSGLGYRQVCTFTFWAGPPLDPPAPRSP